MEMKAWKYSWRGTAIGAAVAAAWLVAAGSAFADPLEDGRTAWQKGDFASAMTTLRPLAENGNAAAQFLVGVMYDSGQGVTMNIPEAVEWFRKAAAQGNADAQYSLGQEYSLGGAMPQDLVEAYMWLDLAAAGYTAARRDTADSVIQMRDLVGRKLSPSQLAEARKRVEAWKAAH